MRKRRSHRDEYLLINTETGKVYEKFMHKVTAQHFLIGHPLKEILEIKPNPKYNNEE
jgi:hypothetical protein